jgi:hypothetical protein
MPDPPDSLEAHYKTVLKPITDGRMVPFLGAGVNLCGRPEGTPYKPGQSTYLPVGRELSAYMAENFVYLASDTYNLMRMSQYRAVISGSGSLYEEPHSVFDVDFQRPSCISSSRPFSLPCAGNAIPRMTNSSRRPAMRTRWPLPSKQSVTASTQCLIRLMRWPG